MNKEKNDEIKIYLAQKICNELEDLLRVKFKAETEFNVIKHSMKIQFWYDEIFNRVYITYELSEYLRYNATLPWNYIYKYINRQLLNNMHRDIGIYPNIIGPTVKCYYDNEITNRLDFSDKFIRPNTYSVWKISDASYKYIESPSADQYIQGYILGVNNSAIYSNFCEDILKLNAEYIVGKDIVDKLDIFDKYAKIFKKYFNRDLSPIPDKDIIRIYIEDINSNNI